MPQILTARRAVAAAARGGPEEILEYVLKDITESRRRKPGVAHSLQAFVPITVIKLFFLGIGPHLISFGGFLKRLFGFFIARVPVRMMLKRTLAVGLFNFFNIGRPLNSQDFVIVSFMLRHAKVVN